MAALPSWIAFALIIVAILPRLQVLKTGFSDPIKIEVKIGTSVKLPKGTTHIHAHALRLYKEVDISRHSYTWAKGRFMTQDGLHESAFETPEQVLTYHDNHARVSHVFEVVRLPPSISKYDDVEFFLDDFCISRFNIGSFRFSDLYIRGKVGAEFFAVSHPTDPDEWLLTISLAATGLLLFGTFINTVRALRNGKFCSFGFLWNLIFSAALLACNNPFWVVKSASWDYTVLVSNMIMEGITHVTLTSQCLMMIYTKPTRSGLFQFITALIVILSFVHGVIKLTANQGIIHNRTITIQDDHRDSFMQPVINARRTFATIFMYLEGFILAITFLLRFLRMTKGQIEFIGLAIFYIRYVCIRETRVYRGEFLWSNDYDRLFQGLIPIFIILSCQRASSDKPAENEKSTVPASVDLGDDEEVEKLKETEKKKKLANNKDSVKTK